MSTGDHVERATSLFRAERWQEASDAFLEADRRRPLGPDDLEMLAVTRYLLGDHAGFVTAMERAHRQLAEEDPPRAVRCAFWIGMTLFMLGDTGPGAGWLSRAGRMTQDLPEDCAERGWILLPEVVQASEAGEHTRALELADRALAIGARHRVPDLTTLALTEQGRSLIRLGDPGHGLPLLDEAMVAVTGGETSPIVTGIVYCSVIAGCREAMAMGRASDWTEALSAWCDAHPDMVPFSGQCLVHRSEVLEMHGSWQEALAEARRSQDRFALNGDDPATGLAHYRVAEMHRLLGRLDEAAQEYERAGAMGTDTQPGLALLRLAEGSVGAAQASIRRALAETSSPAHRMRLLPAQVEISLATADVDEARDAAEELATLAATNDSHHLSALASMSSGAVALADGDAAGALPHLREAARSWGRLGVPYELARTRRLVAEACRRLGDDEAAGVEEDASQTILEKLGATLPPEPAASGGRPTRGGLTEREVEVLRLIAEGGTNKEIATRLYLSVKTIDRHVSNILTKLGVPSRTAATAHAYEHGIL